MPAPRTVNAPTELLPFLFETWPDTKRTRVKQWLKFGSVRVNGQVVTKHSHELKAGDKVGIEVDRMARKAAPPLPAGLKIIHEDDAIIVLDKGPGWLTVALDSGKGRTAYAALTDHVRATNTRNRVWIVHRLDRDTSGLVVFAKTEPYKRVLQQNWHKFDKTYHAIVEGVMKRGGAKPGDKTMIDAVAPAAAKARESVGLPLTEALKAVAAAAEAGKEASKDMIAQFGRAKTLGEACLGFPDAGACSVVIMLSTMRDYVTQS